MAWRQLVSQGQRCSVLTAPSSATLYALGMHGEDDTAGFEKAQRGILLSGLSPKDHLLERLCVVSRGRLRRGHGHSPWVLPAQAEFMRVAAVHPRAFR